MKKILLVVVIIAVLLALVTFLQRGSLREALTRPDEKAFCGGIRGLPCPEGYDCKLDGSYPDASGHCVKKIF